MRVYVQGPDSEDTQPEQGDVHYEARYVSVNTSNGFARASFESYNSQPREQTVAENAEDESPPIVRLAIKILSQYGAYSVVHPACGQGDLSEKLADAGFDVTAFDFAAVSRRAQRRSRNMKRSLVRFVCDDPGLPRRNMGTFDGLIAPHVLSQMLASQRRRLLRNLARLLHSSGVAVLSALSTDDDRYGRGQEIEPDTFEIAPGQVLHFFTDEAFVRELDEFFDIFSLEHLVECETDHRGNTSEFAMMVAAGMKRS
ncbi:MAG: methyltransferase domain-containing protein [Armatimonadota bacterium]